MLEPRWLASIGLALTTLLLAACGGPAAGPTAAATAAPTSAPPAAKPAASPSAVPSPSPVAAVQPTATSEPKKVDTVYVGNTDGEGVYIRRTPVMSDRVRAYPDGTPLSIVGDEVEGDGQHWRHVKTPDGLEGFVPAMYTLETPP